MADAILAGGGKIAGFYDDDPHAVLKTGLGQGPIPHLGRLAEGESVPDPMMMVVGNLARRRQMLHAWGRAKESPRVVHPAAVVSESARIGAGVFVGPRAVVHTKATIYPHAIVNTGAIVEHECEIGENVHLAPGSILAGRVSVGSDTLVGLGAVVLPGVRVGAGCVVGAGAVVRTDVPDGATVVGVPARAIEPSIEIP